jgi:hypothetical protein
MKHNKVVPEPLSLPPSTANLTTIYSSGSHGQFQPSTPPDLLSLTKGADRLPRLPSTPSVMAWDKDKSSSIDSDFSVGGGGSVVGRGSVESLDGSTTWNGQGTKWAVDDLENGGGGVLRGGEVKEEEVVGSSSGSGGSSSSSRSGSGSNNNSSSSALSPISSHGSVTSPSTFDFKAMDDSTSIEKQSMDTSITSGNGGGSVGCGGGGSGGIGLFSPLSRNTFRSTRVAATRLSVLLQKREEALERKLKAREKKVMYANKIIATLTKAGRHISLGYGMHFGWAIEGAIGSNLKIDASYLSPHVNTAARLEAATKQFQTMFLLSEEFVKQLSFKNQKLCRRIDTVVLVGKATPSALFAWDMWLGTPEMQGQAGCHELSPLSRLNPNDGIPVATPYRARGGGGQHRSSSPPSTPLTRSAAPPPPFGVPSQHNAPLATSLREILREESTDSMGENNNEEETKGNGASSVSSPMGSNKQHGSTMTAKMYVEFFSTAFHNYTKGNWRDSEKVLRRCLEVVPDDGPALALLAVLESKGFQAPEKWPGFRSLTEK